MTCSTILRTRSPRNVAFDWLIEFSHDKPYVKVPKHHPERKRTLNSVEMKAIDRALNGVGDFLC